MMHPSHDNMRCDVKKAVIPESSFADVQMFVNPSLKKNWNISPSAMDFFCAESIYQSRQFWAISSGNGLVERPHGAHVISGWGAGGYLFIQYSTSTYLSYCSQFSNYEFCPYFSFF
jgi:hypothetical protein